MKCVISSQGKLTLNEMVHFLLVMRRVAVRMQR